MTTRFMSQAVAAGIFGAAVFAVATSALAAAVDPNSQAPEVGQSQPGNYLAGLIASADRDTSSAEVYYREALRVDPRNSDLIERAFAAALANGDEQNATALGERLLARDPGNSLARLATAVNAIAQGQYATARAQLASGDVRSRDVTAALLTAWCYAGQMDLHHALDALDRIRDPSVAGFRDYHAGLIADYLGNPAEARRRLKSAYDSDRNTLRFVDAYARFLATHGDPDGAKAVYADFMAVVPHHPLIEQAVSTLRAGQQLETQVRSAKDGAAEVLYGLGSAGSRQDDELPALIYLRLSLYLRPGDDLTAVTLANLFDEMKQGDQAIAAFRSVPAASPLRGDADIQIALELESIGKSDDAIQRLQDIVAARPHDADALSSLAGLQRSAKKYAEAAATYDRAIAAVGIPQRDNWTLFYFRGICFERDKQWPKAEADFKKALELYPEQPLVLNYLGYSWVDQGINLDEAFKMLRRAVELKPNDGYIVDSLGWAHFKLGQFPEAAQTLERAISLKPADPVLNDHLGDAYWRVNRRTEAHFQWNHARDMGPEPEDLPAILKKIEVGLPDASDPSTTDAAQKQSGG
ncbi:MAG: tetratricopeptide repeat protein [Roseiarcus sp.]|uniref:tetratricopeptide repeat protein n=1 Tax=Roseiarcus sp. TaxID=1969460 RepID=UPI003BB05EBE